VLKATGTDDTVNGLNKSAAYAQQSGRDSGQTGATGCDDEAFRRRPQVFWQQIMLLVG
tara:strand:- start:837 stop:1010 length:174 start_codon:yes stop_codon:yes gene_type:complete